MLPRWSIALLLMLLAGCSSATRTVRLDTGRGKPIVFTSRSGAEPVELDGDEFKEAVSEWAREVRPPTEPQEAARRLFEVEARSGSYRYEHRSRRITPRGPGQLQEEERPAVELELTGAYLRWCERTGRPGDCLRLLTQEPTVNGDGRFALALALARGAVLDEMLEAFRDMADPDALLAARVPKLPGSAQAAMQAETQVGIRLAAVGEVERVAVSAETITIALAPGAVAMTALTTSGTAAKAPSSGLKAWVSFSGFKKAMGPAGPGKEWHHIVEQTPGNVKRFGAEALHNTENVIPLDKGIHTRISSLYSSIQRDITGSSTLTVRQWLRTQSYEAQREFGLIAIEKVTKGFW